MAAYVLFDIEIVAADSYEEFADRVRDAIDGTGARLLASGDPQALDGDAAHARRAVLMQFDSVSAWTEFAATAGRDVHPALASIHVVSIVGTG